MSRCLNLTRSGEYALAALSRLALMSRAGELVTVEELAAAQRIPRPFLTKILQHCTRAGLTRAKKGAAGGVSLAKRPEDVTVLAVIEACEGSYTRDECVYFAERRCAGPDCFNYCPLRRKEESLRELLKNTTLAEMSLSLKTHPDANSFVGG